MSGYCFTFCSAQSWQFRDERNSKVGTMSYSYQITPKRIHIAHYNRHRCTIQAFEQFGALYMHNRVDKHTNRSEFEASTSEFRATTGSNEPSGPVPLSLSSLCSLIYFRKKNKNTAISNFTVCNAGPVSSRQST